MPVTAVIGGQYGSEGKGLIVGHVAEEYDIHVRVGAANAGHTVYTQCPGEIDPDACACEGHPGWLKHVMQQLPCAAYVNPAAKLVLGAGAMISRDILIAEIVLNAQWRQRRGLPGAKITIDNRAHVVLDRHVEAEQGTDLAERIGSTSTLAREGIGAAQAARVMRTDYAMAGECSWMGLAAALSGHDLGAAAPSVRFGDTVAMLHDALAFNGSVLLEGTQGTGLSNTTGQYPYVTSRNTTSAGLLADVGLAPSDLDDVILVCRTFPIRVAGNSGPFWHDSEETNWAAVGIDEESERTTVTKKVRRVATFSFAQVHHAARINGATRIALTFADYLNPSIAGCTDPKDFGWDYVLPLVRHVEAETGVPVTLVGTGPHSVIERRSTMGEKAA